MAKAKFTLEWEVERQTAAEADAALIDFFAAYLQGVNATDAAVLENGQPKPDGNGSFVVDRTKVLGVFETTIRSLTSDIVDAQNVKARSANARRTIEDEERKKEKPGKPKPNGNGNALK